ncbi:C-3 sterol dehydrogenase/C-4 decarboxylase-like protein [Sporormia fimetaria CBS 119925]|uniref:C-3 sterol dehydrogenase/C-4 decarboxylase-like protein n=1 Tax=Sporormia fimetaria CBS 119925 TaxID=1340428 RepID=A0A6A6VJC8_9PLEO|nr:C-3 sterol dehydrogenase/C-4 decarboxylase-like protein [Sporormia fimetaria CBS 119925]
MPSTKVLITGGTGFLGTELLRLLTTQTSHSITALDLNPPPPGTQVFPNVQYIRCNVLDSSALQATFASLKPDAVIHTVGLYYVGDNRYSMKKGDAMFEVNVEGTSNVVSAAKEAGVRVFVHTSSFAVLVDELGVDFRNADEEWSVGKARLAYGMSKVLEAEKIVLAANSPTFRTCALRSAAIFGPGDPVVIPTIHNLIARGETPFVLGSGTNLVEFVHVTNVAHAHLLALSNLLSSGTAAGEAFYITNGEPVASRAFCLAIWKHFGHVPPFSVSIPKSLAWWAGWAAEWAAWLTGKESSLSRGLIMDGSAERYMNIGKARKVLGYEVLVGLEDGLRDACEYYKKQLEGRKVDKTR